MEVEKGDDVSDDGDDDVEGEYGDDESDGDDDVEGEEMLSVKIAMVMWKRRRFMMSVMMMISVMMVMMSTMMVMMSVMMVMMMWKGKR